MIEVRIRFEAEYEAVRLCDWPATQLDALVPTITGWGITNTSGDTLGDPELTGTIAISPTGAWFEVVVHG